MTESERKKLTFNLARVEQTTVSRIYIENVIDCPDGKKHVYYTARGFKDGALLDADGESIICTWRVL